MPQSCFETFPQLFPKRQDTGKRSERVENYGKIIINTQQNAKNRIPQVLRISQYRNFRSELPKYRMKNWPLPQYRKPQCPPPKGKAKGKHIEICEEAATCSPQDLRKNILSEMRAIGKK